MRNVDTSKAAVKGMRKNDYKVRLMLHGSPLIGQNSLELQCYGSAES